MCILQSPILKFLTMTTTIHLALPADVSTLYTSLKEFRFQQGGVDCDPLFACLSKSEHRTSYEV